MKTKEELNALKQEVETLNKKHAEMSEEELAQLSSGNRGCDSIAICWGDCHGAELDVNRCRSQHVTRCEYGYL